MFYTGLCFLLGSVLYRILFYIGFCFIQDYVFYWVLFYTGFCFIQDYVFYWVLFYIGFPSGLANLRGFWLYCLGSLVYLLPKTFKLFCFLIFSQWSHLMTVFFRNRAHYIRYSTMKAIFIQGSVLYRFCFIQGSVLCRFCFIQGSVLYRIMLFIGFCFIQGYVFYWVLFYTGFCFMQDYLKQRSISLRPSQPPRALTILFKLFGLLAPKDF
jgi:hypothetical protein